MIKTNVMGEAVVDNKRIAKNTILLYFRMIFLMLVSLYTSRVILKALGVEDYGIYNIVGGFVALLSFLNGAISASTSRYITFALGQNDETKLKKIISTCKLTHLIIASLVLVLGESVGIWFILNKLVIPETRMTAALWVYHCSIISTVVMIWSVPYNACIIAHEKMSAFAYISIYEAIMKLVIVFLLMTISLDRLILYALLLLGVQISVRIIYLWYCHHHFEESKAKTAYDKGLFKEIISFAGWNLWGNLAAALFTQGVNIVLNIFFGPVVNAARGIAVTVQSTVQQFASNFQTAINPQITKTYACSEYKAMHTLICRSSKFTFILLYALSLPIIIETPFILNLWLGQVPDYTVNFIRLMLAICVIDAMANPFMTAASATGKVKVYQLVIGSILLLIVPISYMVLKIGGVPESVFLVHWIVILVAFIIRLFFLRSMIGISIRFYLSNVVLPSLIVGIVSTGLILVIKTALPVGVFSSVSVIIISFILVGSFSYLIGLSTSEKRFVRNKINGIIKKIKKDDTFEIYT